MSTQQQEEKDDEERAREEQELEDEEKYDTLWYKRNSQLYFLKKPSLEKSFSLLFERVIHFDKYVNFDL